MSDLEQSFVGLTEKLNTIACLICKSDASVYVTVRQSIFEMNDEIEKIKATTLLLEKERDKLDNSVGAYEKLYHI